jgi:3-methyl-2-oxobutanoate hydroxymethyltransferase
MRKTLSSFAALRERNEPVVMLTCYDASFAALTEEAGVEILLVGDSLGMVMQGHDTTLPVTLPDIAYHTQCVIRGTKSATVLADLPFGAYQASREQAFQSAAQLMGAGAQAVKLEGGAVMADTIRFLVDRGVPVCAHLGLTPQSVHQLGGYKVQGRDEAAAKVLLDDARAVAAAGAQMLVLEMVPAALARQVTASLTIPTIGIGAGVDCSGQVLVLQDMLDIYPGKKARFVRNFMAEASSIRDGIRRYVEAVKTRAFPSAAHSY